MLAIRFLRSLYPLLKDIFLEEKSLKEAAIDSKGKILLLVAVLFSIFLNFYIVPKILHLSNRVVLLNKELDKCRNEVISTKFDNAVNNNPVYDRQKYFIDNFEDLIE